MPDLKLSHAPFGELKGEKAKAFLETVLSAALALIALGAIGYGIGGQILHQKSAAKIDAGRPVSSAPQTRQP